MLIFKQLVLGLLLPAIVGGGIFVLAFKSRRNQTEEGSGLFSGWLFSAALSVGYIVGYIGLEGFPPFPAREGVHWLCYLALIGLILGIFWRFEISKYFNGQVLASAVMAFIPPLLLDPMFKHTWGQVEGFIWWFCLIIVIAIFWSMVQGSFTLLPSGGWSPFVYFGLSGGTALVLALSGSLRLAQHAGILVALFAAIWIITLFLRSDAKVRVFPISTSPVITLAFAGIWMNGYFYEEVPAASAILLAMALCLAPVGRVEAIQRLGGGRSAFVQVVVIALPVLIAIGIAVGRSGLFGE
ncbi:MAG: hypothetical protein OXU51_19305, partial [Candidatus Poribacteria bacterium]|nr:hypothetical protein [Candidatus Poribacteria bacterium]